VTVPPEPPRCACSMPGVLPCDEWIGLDENGICEVCRHMCRPAPVSVAP
jgi:hypothetical protein